MTKIFLSCHIIIYLILCDFAPSSFWLLRRRLLSPLWWSLGSKPSQSFNLLLHFYIQVLVDFKRVVIVEVFGTAVRVGASGGVEHHEAAAAIPGETLEDEDVLLFVACFQVVQGLSNRVEVQGRTGVYLHLGGSSGLFRACERVSLIFWVLCVHFMLFIKLLCRCLVLLILLLCHRKDVVVIRAWNLSNLR